jgi:CheY-like chemotaxis protein
MTVSLASQRVLLIDDMAVVRQTIKSMLVDLGITHIDFAASVGEARRRIQAERYDVVLCDYHMGNGANGQDFLEEIRHTGVLPLETVFFMVTSEASYEKVVSVAEVAPDDYMLKPFSSRDLVERLSRTVRKKLVLKDLYHAIRHDAVDRAIQVGREIMAHNPSHRLDAARLLAQLLNDYGRIDEAMALYKEVLDHKAVPWARLGLAGIYAQTGQKKEAAEIYQDLLAQSPNYVEVYDRLAQHYLDEGQEDKAMAIMERAVAITPNNVARLQTAGNLAFRLGKGEAADALLKRAVVVGGNSNALSPRVLYNLLVSACRDGRQRDADQYLAMLTDMVEKTTDLSVKALQPLARAVVEVMVGRLEAAIEIGGFTVNSLIEGQLDNDLALDLLSLASLLPDDAEAPPNWVRRVTARYAVSRPTWERLRIALHRRPVWAEVVVQEAQRIQDIANEGMSYIVNHQYSKAAEFLRGHALTTRNPRLVRNAYNACVKAVASGDEAAHAWLNEMQPMFDQIEHSARGAT